MLVPSRLARLLLVGLAACAATWAFAAVASAKPLPVGPVDPSAWTAAASPVHPGTGGRTVPAPTTADSGPQATGGDTDTVALVLAIVALVVACSAVTLTITRPRGRLQT